MSDPHSFILNPNNVTKNLKRIPVSQQSGWDADVSRLSQNVTMSQIKTLYKQDNHFNHFLLVVDKINANIYVSFQTLYEGDSICILVRNFIHIKHEEDKF